MSANLPKLAMLLPLVLLTSAACSRTDELCALVCDCEHCNDWDEEDTCAQFELSLEVAQAYDCEAAWESWAECFENNGQCIEGQAVYTTNDATGEDRCEQVSLVLLQCEQAAAGITVTPVYGGSSND